MHRQALNNRSHHLRDTDLALTSSSRTQGPLRPLTQADDAFSTNAWGFMVIIKIQLSHFDSSYTHIFLQG